MDPFTAIGLASNILQFVEFGTKLVTKAKDVHVSGTGMAAEDESLAHATHALEHLAVQLIESTNAKSTSHEEDMPRKTSLDCKALADELLALLKELQAHDPNSKRQSVRVAWKSTWKAKEKAALEERLSRCGRLLE
ncbi:Uu.00g087860.m01.CDS01 [Anthostomella pinea]|uniref:Uu.00g087860.m01.CDS01 n=1 Tax=Anthostomella pinea TaxID=933095 RepID=A0AAI8VNK8_9PEZI|nr:Uu.00g087860.m01.CDS01 [Anthostomella pinea]